MGDQGLGTRLRSLDPPPLDPPLLLICSLLYPLRRYRCAKLKHISYSICPSNPSSILPFRMNINHFLVPPILRLKLIYIAVRNSVSVCFAETCVCVCVVCVCVWCVYSCSSTHTHMHTYRLTFLGTALKSAQ